MTLGDKLKNSIFPNKQLQQDMIIRVCGAGKHTHYASCSNATRRIEWVSQETDTNGEPVSVRIPEESSRKLLKDLPFVAGGKTYANWRLLCVDLDEDRIRGKDVYGREVLCVTERFPCFDSYDYLHENRYFRWFLIRQGNTLTRVFCQDDNPEVHVTEDVANLEERLINILQKLGRIL